MFIASLALLSCNTSKTALNPTNNQSQSQNKNHSHQTTNSVDLEQANFTKHMVKNGETLCTIAKQYGVTINSLISANEITNPDLIIIGQELLITHKEDSLSEN